MAESILQRVHRILSARVGDAVDCMEQTNNASVMREAIREVDRAIDQVGTEYDAAVARRLQAVRQQKLFRDKAAELTGKAAFALKQEREDLAQAALMRQLDYEAQASALEAVQTRSGSEEAHLEDGLAALRTRKAQMDESLDAFLTARREAAVGGDGPSQVDRVVEKQVSRAEEAFDRAMSGAGGAGFTRSDAETITRVSEIDVLQRAAAVADRLAALKSSQKAA